MLLILPSLLMPLLLPLLLPLLPLLPIPLPTLLLLLLLLPSVHEPARAWPYRGTDYLRVATSGFGDSDIDVFFYGLTPQQANNKLKQLRKQLHYSQVGLTCIVIVSLIDRRISSL